MEKIKAVCGKSADDRLGEVDSPLKGMGSSSPWLATVS